MLSYAEVFYEGARSQLLPTSIVLRAVWCYLSLREDGEGARRDRGRGREGGREKRGPRLFQLWTVLSRASLMDLQAASRQSSVAASCLGIWSEKKYLIRSTC